LPKTKKIGGENNIAGVKGKGGPTATSPALFQRGGGLQNKAIRRTKMEKASQFPKKGGKTAIPVKRRHRKRFKRNKKQNRAR